MYYSRTIGGGNKCGITIKKMFGNCALSAGIKHHLIVCSLVKVWLQSARFEDEDRINVLCKHLCQSSQLGRQ
jgi:hypothetical protein